MHVSDDGSDVHVKVGQASEQRRIVGSTGDIGKLSHGYSPDRGCISGSESLQALDDVVGHVPEIESPHVALC